MEAAISCSARSHPWSRSQIKTTVVNHAWSHHSRPKSESYTTVVISDRIDHGKRSAENENSEY